mmetsp:Transcript_6342/g.11361  ORF Transcript_6342/g.11361 Transcript_6342/m.11361 type:complete len:395 (+) Transcript_6342:1007-2191(+)
MASSSGCLRHAQHAPQGGRHAREATTLRRHPVGRHPGFRMGAHRPHDALEQDGVDRGLEVVVGDELQQAPPALGHLGALAGFGHAAQVAVGDDLDHIPFGVGIEGLLDVRRIEQLEHLDEVVTGLHGQCEDVAIGGAVQRIAQVQADALHGGHAAEGPLFDDLAAADDLADQQVAEVLADRHHEAHHLAVEVAVDHRAGRRLGRAVVEGAAVGHHAVLPGVAQGLPLLQQVEAACAGAALDAHLAESEQAQQRVHHLEDLHALMLVDVIQLRGCVQLAGHDGVVEVRSDRGVADLVEADRALRPQPEQIEEAGVGVAAGFAEQLAEALLELRRHRVSFLGRQVGHLLLQEGLPQPLDGLGGLEGHGGLRSAWASGCVGSWSARAPALPAVHRPR